MVHGSWFMVHGSSRRQIKDYGVRLLTALVKNVVGWAMNAHPAFYDYLSNSEN
jgi:hypothetical protein